MTENESFMEQHGATLAANGYHIIPILPGQKMPGKYQHGLWIPYSGWQKHCDRPTANFELEIWSRFPDCAIGLACGGVIGIDIDVLDDAAAHAIEVLAREMLGDTPAKRVGMAPKRALFYRTEEPFGGMKRHPLEIYGRGQQMVIYAIHPATGLPYQWPGESLTEIDSSRIPLITQDMAKAFLDRAWELVPAELRSGRLGGGGASPGSSPPSGDLKGTAEAIKAALAYVPNNDLGWDDWIKIGLAIKGALGDKGRAIWLEWSDTSPKNVDKISAFEWRRFNPNNIGAGTIYWLAEQAGWVPDAAMILNGDAAEAAEAPHPAAGLIAAALARVTASTHSAAVAPGIMDLDGALGMIVDYSTRTAKSPQPFLALGAAIATVGALAGRRYASPTDLRTNVMVIALADSGSGKDQPRKCVRRALFDAGVTQYLGGEEWASGQAIFGSLEEFPARLFMINEFGHVLNSVTSHNASAHKANIMKNLTSLFTSASEMVPGTEYAKQTGKEGKKRVDLFQPHVCVYGDTVAAVLWKAMQSGALGDGSIARFLVFQTPEDCPDFNRNMSPMDAPADLIQRLKAIAAGVPGHNYGGNLSSIMQAQTPMRPYVVPYGKGVAELLDQADEEQLTWKRENRNTWASAFIARSVEHTIRVAMIRAISRDPVTPIIETTDIRWAQALVEHCLVTAMRETENHVADSKSESDIKKLLEVVRKAGKGGVSKSDLIRRTRFIDTRQRNAIVADLVSTGDLWETVDKSADKPKTTYTASPGKVWRRGVGNDDVDE